MSERVRANAPLIDQSVNRAGDRWVMILVEFIQVMNWIEYLILIHHNCCLSGGGLFRLTVLGRYSDEHASERKKSANE